MTTPGSTLPPVLVLGATGGQGGAVAAALIRAGRPVRALVRDPAAPAARRLAAAGAQLAAGDFTDPETLTTAMQGAAAAFALTTPFESGPGAELEQGRAIVEAAAAARLGHLVFSSVAGATQETGIPHFESKAAVERILAASCSSSTGPTWAPSSNWCSATRPRSPAGASSWPATRRPRPR
jgi:uncharacterized protein YbjT (DUF2867 family)